MTLAHKDAHTLARVLAEQFSNEAPWSDTGDVNSDDACGQVSDALDPAFEATEAALMAELDAVIDPDLARRLSDFLGAHAAHSQDGGYLFGLAVGQRIHVPALASVARVGTGQKKARGGR